MATDSDDALAFHFVEPDPCQKTRGRYECSEDLSFGRILELANGKLRAPQTPGSAGNIVGGLAYDPAGPSCGYVAGAWLVPLLRKGVCWIPYVGTAPTLETQVNICSSSSDATSRGKVTGDATSTTAGGEIYSVKGITCVELDTNARLALVEFNLPA